MSISIGITSIKSNMQSIYLICLLIKL